MLLESAGKGEVNSISLISVSQSVLCNESDNVLRSAFGQDNSDFRLVYDSSRDICHHWDGDSIPAVDRIPARRVLQRSVESKSERIVPPPKKRVTGTHLKNAVLVCLACFGHRRCCAQIRGGYITVQVVIISIGHTGWKVESQAIENVRW